MEVDHGGGDIGVSHELLDSSNVDTGLQEVGCETMSKGMETDPLGDVGFTDGVFKLPLERFFMEVVASDIAVARMNA